MMNDDADWMYEAKDNSDDEEEIEKEIINIY